MSREAGPRGRGVQAGPGVGSGSSSELGGGRSPGPAQRRCWMRQLLAGPEGAVQVLGSCAEDSERTWPGAVGLDERLEVTHSSSGAVGAVVGWWLLRGLDCWRVLMLVVLVLAVEDVRRADSHLLHAQQQRYVNSSPSTAATAQPRPPEISPACSSTGRGRASQPNCLKAQV